ncbi:MAG: hypothetical protein HYY46_13100 [Deltaproteobacteria bacterium]|nr:hypothetical protein [Deltaproteobacteria bacterium]
MKTWKRILAALLLTMFVASSCATLSAPRLTEEEEEHINEMFPYGGD